MPGMKQFIGRNILILQKNSLFPAQKQVWTWLGWTKEILKFPLNDTDGAGWIYYQSQIIPVCQELSGSKSGMKRLTVLFRIKAN